MFQLSVSPALLRVLFFFLSLSGNVRESFVCVVRVREGGTEREREKESLCVRVCLCVREKEGRGKDIEKVNEKESAY